MKLLASFRVRVKRAERRGTGLSRWLWSRWLVVALAAIGAAVVVVLVATSDSGPDPRPLTADEANRLSIARFRNYQAGGRAVTITVPGTAGGLVIRGSIDYRNKLGYGVMHGSGRDSSSNGLLAWTPSTVLVHPMEDAPADAPPEPPRENWFGRPLQTTGRALDTSLAIALGLGNDRPDNAQLLPQNGATWLGRDQVSGHSVDIMTGPNANATPGTADTVRYWVDSDGTMYRVQVDVASEPEPVIIEFDTHPYVPVSPIPGTGAPR